MVVFWYSETIKYDVDGNRLENKSRYYQLLNENILIKSLPECLSVSEEFLERKVKYVEESKELVRLEKKVTIFNFRLLKKFPNLEDL